MKIFLGILVFFLIFGWLVLLFSAIGLFYIGTVTLSILASAFLTIYFLLKISQNTGAKAGKSFYFVILISLIVSFATCYFATPNIFGGRDQGSIGTAAIYLSKNHNLKIDLPVAQGLFQKYGPGKTLNFPGFDYQKDGRLVSRFPVGFTSYLAANYNIFGLKGIQYANFIPLFLFLVIFWLILIEIFDKKVSFAGFLIAATFFPFIWFSKYALTEIYMLFLVWTGIYFLLSLQTQRRNLETAELNTKSSHSLWPLAMTNYWLALAFLALSALVRIEGIIFFLLAVGYILLLQRKNVLPKTKNIKKYLLISTISLLIIYIYLNFPDLIDSSKNLIKAFLPNSVKESAPSANLYSYLGRIFFNYNILTYLVIGLAGIVWFAKNIRKNWKKPEFLPIFITFPVFLYLLSPMITLDDPWLLRRFVFAVFPALIIYSIYTLQKFFYHKMFLYFVFIVLIAANSVVSWRFFRTSENKNLLPQIEKISQKFGPDDLILVDRLATISGYSLMSEPLRTIYGKNAVYFFNTDDLKYVNQDKYKNIYLIAPLPEENLWYTELIKKKNNSMETITNNFLEPSEKKWALAQNVTSEDFVVIWKLK